MVFDATLVRQKHVHGDVKTVNKFAWLPRSIGDKIVWLSKYEVLFIYHIETYITDKLGKRPAAFQIGKWVSVSKRII